ncbi:MAG: outer membrane lipoprotein carrier protein LolA [Bacteroidia bacterium]|nr:outer membrane lipoprotein carrier protein LolA [Bacteroidia bacterium]
MKNLIIYICCALSLQAFAQKSGPDKNADKLLSTISKRYKAFKTMKADFVYAIESKAEKFQEKQKGTLLVKGNKFKLDIAGQTIICDNATLWTYTKEVNEVQISNYNPKENAIRIDDIFTMYNKGFISRIVEEKKEGNREIAVVELTPTNKKKNYFKIKITIDKTNQTLIKSIVYDKNGTIHTYTITNQVPNLKLDDKTFTFNASKYPNIEVIDLRN